jgi:MurNAc alpha-1-phosphate uridylyltransferase
MRAMILAAGLGKRLRPFTDHTPKPLLPVNNKPLIVYHLEALAQARIVDIVININLGHLGKKIKEALGNGHSFGVNIEYSLENPALETGGGIAKALPQLGPDPFLVVSGDILTHFPFERLPMIPKELAHIVLVDNPPYHSEGDYALIDGFVAESGGNLLNFAGIGVYHPALFAECPIGAFRLPFLFEKAFRTRQVTGEYYSGLWHNIGTLEELKRAEEAMLQVS